MRNLLVLILALGSLQGLGQNNESTQKGTFYFYWGYNRSVYTPSDITFTGPGYNFTLHNVHATDRPTAFTFKDYFKPANISIPQYVYRLGYFISDNFSVSLGMDHMKYVMPQNQSVLISGEINQSNNPFNGNYADDEIVLTPDFLTYEHTDGLNYLSVEANWHLKFWEAPSQKIKIAGFAGPGVGMLIPKSNVQLMSGERNDEFHIAGFGMHANAGVQFTFFNHLFFRTQAKGGYINMPDVITRPDDVEDRAKQQFGFAFFDFSLGWQWHF